MNKKKILIISIIVLLLAFLGLYIYYLIDEFGSITANPYSDNEEVTLNVSSEGPYKLKDIIEDIKTNDHYKGYDPKTVEWMEKLPVDSVWTGKQIVIMSSWDSDNIPSESVCDAYITQTINCEVIEKHSLGKNLKDVYYVKNVEFVKSETHPSYSNNS
jgi:hypothetical protein